MRPDRALGLALCALTLFAPVAPNAWGDDQFIPYNHSSDAQRARRSGGGSPTASPNRTPRPASPAERATDLLERKMTIDQLLRNPGRLPASEQEKLARERQSLQQQLDRLNAPGYTRGPSEMQGRARIEANRIRNEVARQAQAVQNEQDRRRLVSAAQEAVRRVQRAQQNPQGVPTVVVDGKVVQNSGGVSNLPQLIETANAAQTRLANLENFMQANNQLSREQRVSAPPPMTLQQIANQKHGEQVAQAQRLMERSRTQGAIRAPSRARAQANARSPR